MKIVIERDSPPNYPLTRITVELSNEASVNDLLDAFRAMAIGMDYWVDKEVVKGWIEERLTIEEEA